MKEIISKTVSSLKEVVSIYPWLKLALASSVGVFGGAGFITFLNKYAIYNYAVSYGGRLPVESVPYIDVAISILSFAFLSISLVSVLLIYGVLTYIAELLHSRFEKVPVMIIKVASGVITSVIGGVASSIFRYLYKDGEAGAPPTEIFPIVLIIIGIGLVLGGLIIWKSLIRPFALIASISLISLVGYKIFDADNYASFLRAIQYGGGVPVTLVLGEGKNETKGYLFLTTKTTSIIWVPTDNNYVETPVSSVKSIQFHKGEPYKMPKISGSLVSIVRHLW